VDVSLLHSPFIKKKNNTHFQLIVAHTDSVISDILINEILGVIENMAFFQPADHEEKYYIFGRGGSEQLASKLGTELIAQFPIYAPNQTDFEPSIYKKGSHLFDKYNELAQKVQDSIA
jgi:ATP-binding protein involved in chromosome partitioning